MTVRDIKDTALRYLAYRNHTVFEMRKHLLEKEYGVGETDDTLLHLIELNYLDDYNYAREYIRYGVSKGKGILRIKNELIQKGVTLEMIEKAVDHEEESGEALDTCEMERALHQAKKTVGEQEITEKIIGKLGRRLAGLGYSMDVIYKVIGVYMKQNQMEDVVKDK